MANTSLKDNIYSYLNSITAIKNAVDQIGWGQMPDTAITKKQIVFSMLNDNRLPESQLRNQLWRFWYCFPANGTTPKAKSLTLGNLMLDNMHNMRGTFGSTLVHFIENVSNIDPFFDTTSNSWILIQDYKIKMKTLEV